MTTVRRHTRTVAGRTVKVRRHSKKLEPARASLNARRAIRSTQLRRHSDAAVFASLALAEIAAWVTMRGVAFAVITLAIALTGLGLALRQAAR